MVVRARLLALCLLLACARAPAKHEAAAPGADVARSTAAPAAAAPVTALPANASPAVGELRPAARVVAQTLLGQPIGVTDGGRFALLAGGTAVDLLLGKVAWQLPGELTTTSAGEHHAAYVTRQLPPAGKAGRVVHELHVIDLLTGAEQTFVGEPLPHASLPPQLMALREGNELGIVDAVRRAWWLRVVTEREPQSLVLSADGKELYVLEWNRADVERQPHDFTVRLELFRASGDQPAGSTSQPFVRYARADWRISGSEIDAQTQSPHASIRSSMPRLYHTDGGALVMGIRSGCPQCRMLAPYVVDSRAVDVRTGEAIGAWSFRLEKDLPANALAVRAWVDPCSPPDPGRGSRQFPPGCWLPPIPDQVLQALTKIKSVPFGAFVRPCRDGACFMTDGRDLCMWSLDRARQVGCRARNPADSSCVVALEAVDETKVFVSRCGAGGPLELGLWNPRTNRTEARRFGDPPRDQAEAPFVFAPSGLRFLKRVGTRTEAWTWGREAPDWSAECHAPSFWNADGTSVLCARSALMDRRGRYVLAELDAARGKERRRVRRVGAQPDYPQLPCGLTLEGSALRSGEQLAASLYFFDDGEWAFVLPSGEHSASARGSEHLAFFAADGTELDERSIAALARPQAVAARLASVATCPDER